MASSSLVQVLPVESGDWGPCGGVGGWGLIGDGVAIDGLANSLCADAVEEVADGSAAGGVGLAVALAPDDADDLAMGVEHAAAAVAGADGAGDSRRGVRCAAAVAWPVMLPCMQRKMPLGPKPQAVRLRLVRLSLTRERLDFGPANSECGQIVGAIEIDRASRRIGRRAGTRQRCATSIVSNKCEQVSTRPTESFAVDERAAAEWCRRRR